MFTLLLFSGDMRWIFAVPFFGGSAEDDADADAFVDRRRSRNRCPEAAAPETRFICRRTPRTNRL